ncbi:MAG: recombination mediator RecR [Xanthomonadales bacterium]|jgi:recombination protein RecR|nr:recombination mediator RecR [Xanthomonadales bacterium]MDH3923403.1 recombination mediator RecR [Xanthomonadales bacterium]MDH3939439.1 recombination mediator RecR [Xanthomonadales bacterium]MDH4001094.1 recombination mediator RecR [Xanthomonadales bacterium]
MSSEPLLDQLIDALRCLPGVGPKSAQRMALHLLERDRDGGKHLSTLLDVAMERIGRCSECRNLTEKEICSICANDQRDRQQLCIVESPSDVIAIEHATGYRGRYFVLMGHLSPIDGIGPADLGLDLLAEQLGNRPPAEMIIATNPTVEGEATAYYVQRMAQKHGVQVSRIAHGVPLGGELEFTDQSTIAHAFSSRQAV